MEYDNTNAGAIFKNETATGNQPTYRGKINVDGVDKQIAMWVKQTKDGKPFFSVKISEPYNAELPTTQAPKPQQKDEIDSLPF
jgi:uncharacterized protein (DUF736 family)